VAAHAEIRDENLSILAGVWSLDGSQKKLKTLQVNAKIENEKKFIFSLSKNLIVLCTVKMHHIFYKLSFR
jgi:hypothetical protein